MTHYNVEVRGVEEAIYRHIDSISSSPEKKAEMKRWVRTGLERPGVGPPTEAADRCMDQFIDSELDADAAGCRGIGRANDDVPRLAGFHRDVISKLDAQARLELGRLIKCHMISGYLTAPLMHDLATRTPRDEQVLYEAWISCMYPPAFQIFPSEDTMANVQMWGTGTAEDLGRFLGARGIAPQQADVTIVSCYFAGGIILRMVESLPYSLEHLPEFNTLKKEGAFEPKQQPRAGATEAAKQTGCLVALAILLALPTLGIFSAIMLMHAASY